MEGQAIFNVVVAVLAGLLQLWPWFRDWWDGFEYRDMVVLAACALVAGGFLAACALGMAMSNCSRPIGLDDIWHAILAAGAAFALWHAAQTFRRAGYQSKALARAVARKILVADD